MQLLQCLTNDDQSGKNVKVIWYTLPKLTNRFEDFNRLNVGKFRSRTRNIQAMFLRSRNFGSESKSWQQLRLLRNGMQLRNRFNPMKCGLFTTGTTSPPSRIEFLFEQIAGEDTIPKFDDPFATFHFYNDRIGSAGVTAVEEWLRVKQAFMTLEEWFSDRLLFHLVGYLIHDNYKLGDLRKEASGITKSGFRLALRHTIFRRLIGESSLSSRTLEDYRSAVGNFVDNLDYDSDRKTVRSLLLLFNIATIVLNPKLNL